jgi:hypothetical protein
MSLAALLVVALVAQASTPGQTPSRTPTRDPRAATAKGTGIIRGQVVDATSGAPIRRATVRLYGSVITPDSTVGAVTDDDGRFEIRDLQAGKFTLSATKSGFVTGTAGQTRSSPPPTVELLDKQIADKVVLKLARGGVIVGRVMDEAGEPAVGVEVRALQYRYGPGGRTLEQTSGFGMFRSDDLGAFRVYGLMPGQYIVTARPNEGFIAQPTTLGDTGPATTYFPNSADPSTAQRVTVAASRETGPVIITLVSTKLSAVRGRALMANGQPFAATSVSVTVRESNGSSSRPGARTQPDGSFEVRGLTPGTYELEVRPQSFTRDEESEVARQTITVTGEDIEGVLLIGSKPGIARGRVITDEGSPLPYPSMNVIAQAPGQGYRFYSSPAIVKGDATFELKGLFGQRLFRLGGFTAPPSGGQPWMLKAVMHDGVDITDKPMEIPPGSVIEGLELVFTQKAAELSGTVTMSGDARFEDATIILFPADESLWADTQRFIRLARPDKAGAYKFSMIPAHHDYLLVTALQLEPGQFMDPDFLRSVRDRAMRLSLSDGEKRVQNIRIATSQ